MLVPFLIMLREGVEAALIVGIIASYLRQTGRGTFMPFVWVGVFLAIACSLVVGAALQLLSADFPQKAQELFEAIVGVIAAIFLCSMVFWMRKASRSIKAELHDSIDHALQTSQGQVWALVGMAFLAVAREGLESVFFLLAVFQQSDSMWTPLGALLGIAAAVAVGFGIYAGGVKLNLRVFFRWTGIFVLLVAAGILANALRALHEAGVWNSLQGVAFDFSAVLPVDSPLGALLSALFGYQEMPKVGEVIVYIGFLALSLIAFLRPPVSRPAATVSGQGAR